MANENLTPGTDEGKATDPAFSQPWRVRQSTVSKDFILERPDRRGDEGYSAFKFEANRAVLDFICSGINDRGALLSAIKRAHAVLTDHALSSGHTSAETVGGLLEILSEPTLLALVNEAKAGA